MKNVMKEVLAYLDDMITWRRDFHMHPELGWQEVRTSKKIIEILESLGIKVIKDFCKTAVIAVIEGELPGFVLGVRAEMDALPMSDEKEVPYKSTVEGVCHSCGHDSHLAVGLCIAKYFQERRHKLQGTVKIFFQPAEEGVLPSGASQIIESGYVDDVDAMLGFHSELRVPVGSITLRYGALYGSGDNFKVTIQGCGTHAAYPHKGTDSILTASKIISSYQEIISREIDPVESAVLSVCYFHAGDVTVPNAIPDTVVFGGTVRALSNEVREYILNRIESVGKAIAEMERSEFIMEKTVISPVLINDFNMTKLIEEVAKELIGDENITWIKGTEMGFDDFAFYSQKIPAVDFSFGVGNEEKGLKYYHHHPKFDMDEEGMCTGAAIAIAAIYKYNDIYKKEMK